MIAAVQARLDAAEDTAAPKYLILRDAILNAIAGGDWVAGARLPTEAELSRSLPFSLGTVQRAYGELVKERVVKRSRGTGSFVAPPDRQLAEPWHCRFLAPDGTILPVLGRLVGSAEVEKDWSHAALFGGEADLVRIDRLMSIGGEFEVLSRFYVRRSIGATIIDRPHEQFETGNFKAMLLRELGIPITRIVQTICTPDRHLWTSLGLPAKPHMLLEATAYARQSDIAYFQELFIPANSRKLLFDTELRL